MGARRSGDGETVAARCELKYHFGSKTYRVIRCSTNAIDCHRYVVRLLMSDGREKCIFGVLVVGLDMNLLAVEDLQDSFRLGTVRIVLRQ